MSGVDPQIGDAGSLPETQWSLIHRCQDPEREEFRHHLDALFQKYWTPVFRYIAREWARNLDEAQDMTQGFFLAFLERGFLDSVEADRGRFRSFLFVAVRHFLSNWKRDARAKKRLPPGGLLSLDALRSGGADFDLPDQADVSSARQFDRDWRRSLLDAALRLLRKRAAEQGREAAVDLLVRYDIEREAGVRLTYFDLAESFGLTVFQVRGGLRWARQQYMDCIRMEIREQVATEDDYRREAMELLGLST